MKRSSALALTIACLAPVSVPALAQDAAGETEANAIVEAQVETSSSIFASQAVSETTLRTIAGREDTTQLSQADLKASVSQNSVGENSVTGAAQIDGNAFQNMSGMSILNVNTGNNVAINAAMNVNISISPAP